MYLHHLSDSRQAATVLNRLIQRVNVRKSRRNRKVA